MAEQGTATKSITLDPAVAASSAIGNSRFHPGAFYGSPTGLSVGIGLIYRNVTFPLFNLQDRAFDTAAGVACVLTHECDIDPTNNRHFNDQVLICPIITMDNLLLDLS